MKPMTAKGLPHSVRCPACGAVEGDRCVTKVGKPLPRWFAHKDRVEKARWDRADLASQVMAAPDLDAPWVCCGHGWADLDSYDQHRARGHGGPEELGMTPTATGWRI